MADDDIRKQREDLAKEIKDVADKLKPRFRKLIKNIQDANAPLAKQVADIREASKGTYAGTLQAAKLANVGGMISGYIKDLDTSLDAGQLKELQKVLGEEFDLEGFRESSVKVKEYEEAVIAATDARAARLATAEKKENALGQMDAQIADLRDKQGRLQGAALNNATEELKALEEARETKKKEILAGFDRDLKDAQELLDAETEVRKEYNDRINTKFKELSDDAGKLGAFSDGVKKLTGFDIMGLADGVVENVNAFGKIISFGKNEDLAGSILEGFQSIPDKFKGMTEGIGKGVSSLGEGMSEGVSSLKDGVVGLGKGIRKTASGMMASAKSMGGKFIGILSKGAKMLGGFVKGLARGLMGAAKALFAAITPFIAAAAAFVGSLLMTAGSMLLAAAPYIAIGAGILAAAYLMYKAFMYLYENVEGFRGYIDTVIGFVKNIGQAIFDIFLGFKDMIVGIFTGDFDMVMEGLKGIFGGLWDLLLAPFKAIGDFFKNVFDIDIGKMLKNFARKILPGWLADRLFGKESDEPMDDVKAEQVSGESPAPKKALEDEDTQQLLNRRKAREAMADKAQALIDNREMEVNRAMQGDVEVNGRMLEGDEKRAYLEAQADTGRFDKDKDGKGITTEQLRNIKDRQDMKAMEIQGELDTRRDYLKKGEYGEYTVEQDPTGGDEDIKVYADTGDRVKTAEELRKEATEGMGQGMSVNTANSVTNNNATTNTTVNQTPRASDDDTGSKYSAVPTYGYG